MRSNFWPTEGGREAGNISSWALHEILGGGYDEGISSTGKHADNVFCSFPSARCRRKVSGRLLHRVVGAASLRRYIRHVVNSVCDVCTHEKNQCFESDSRTLQQRIA
jgi:hypothetical protein